MTSLLAGDLALLGWDDARGKAAWRASSTLNMGIAGALLLDAVLGEALRVEDDRVVVAGRADDPLLQDAVEVVAAYRRPPKVQRVVQRLATNKRKRSVIDRLVAQGVLRTEQHRVLGVFPVTRHPVTATEQAERLRAEVVALLTGRADADTVDDRLVMAALAGSSSLIDGLVDRGERRDAKKRAKEFGQGDGISPAVREAIQAAQAATVAVIAAGSAASSSGSS